MNSNILNITNGDGAGNLLKASAIQGEVLPWQDTMQSGPFPSGLSLEEHSKLRAQFFSGPNMPLSEVEKDFKARDEKLKSFKNYDEVILWFEHDVLDQLQILQILNFFAAQELESTKLSLICINQFEEIEPFRGLGQLTPEQIATLLPLKSEVTPLQLKTAQSGWQAFCSSDPTDLERFIHSDLSSLPFLKAALKRHLEEYPSIKNGLNKTQNKILELVKEGVTNPGKIFHECMNSETLFFMGDWTYFKEISALCNGEHSLLSCKPNGQFLNPADNEIGWSDFLAQELSITGLGKEVLNGHKDATKLLKLDQWFGGVHLDYKRPIWRWDAEREKLVKAS